MVEPIIENLRGLSDEIAADLGEKFGTEHLALAMDKIIPGPAYVAGTPDHPNPFDLADPDGVRRIEDDSLELKLNKLVVRADAYLKYDRYLAENGQGGGNREIDAARIRISTYDAHVKELTSSSEEEENRRRLLSFMCKTNGMFLGREVLNRDFTFFTHGPMFDFFVQKNPYKTIAQQDTEHKIRLLEMPRGSYKSTGDGVDCVQWIIVNPDIRIMFLTASLTLAKDFVGEVKNYFTVPVNENEPSPFQYLFASDTRLERPRKKVETDSEIRLEYERLNFLIPEGKEGKETEFISPARTRGDQQKRNVTIWAGSVGAGKVGKHCDIIKADDAVDEKNTDTPKLISKTKKRIGMASKLVDAGGFKDNMGTPYAPNDWYNHIHLEVKDILTLIRPAKWLKKDINGATAIDRGKQFKDLQDGDWTLLFPVDKHGEPKLTHDQLRANQDEDPDGFPSQYMLDPHGYKKVSFPEGLLYQQTVHELPAQIEKYAYYILWDLADTQGIQSDYSVGAVLAVDREHRGYIVEIFRDRYTFHDLCYVIAKSNHDYKPIRIIIENARGAEKLRGDMVRASQDLGDQTIPLEFVKVSNQKAAKAVRIGKLEPRLKDRMLFFLDSISCYQDLISEFRDFGSAPHDDIPDAIGFSEYVLPDGRSAPADPNAALVAQRILNQKAFYEMIHTSPEQNIVEQPVAPLPEVSESPDDLWDPYSTTPFKG